MTTIIIVLKIQVASHLSPTHMHGAAGLDRYSVDTGRSSESVIFKSFGLPTRMASKSVATIKLEPEYGHNLGPDHRR